LANVAYKVNEQHIQYQPQQPQKAPKTLTKKKRRITLGERVLWLGLAAATVWGSVEIVSNQASLYSVNAEIQGLEKNVDSQTRVNKELKQEVTELSTYERIWAKAKELGLDLNENNVKVVQE